MDKICEKCGNLIPQGADVCPNCQQKIDSDASVDAVLRELTAALNDTATEATGGTEASELNGNDTILFDLSIIDKATAQVDAMIRKENADKESEADNEDQTQTEKPADAVTPETPVKKKKSLQNGDADKMPNADGSSGERSRKKRPTSDESTGTSKKRKKSSGQTQSVERKAVSGSQSEKRTANTGSKSGKGTQKKKKKRKRKTSGKGATIAATIIAILVALLLVAGAALLFLYQMGVFSGASDDALLAVPEHEPVASELPAPPEVSEEPAEEVASVQEPEVIEVSLDGENGGEDEEEEDRSHLHFCDTFEITTEGPIYLYSRGQTAEIEYEIDPQDAAKEIRWSSSDEMVATVSDYGVVAARRGGKCTITAECGDKSDTITVYCPFSVPNTVMDMNYEDVTMSYEGQQLELKIDYELTEEQIEMLVWESTDEKIAKVDKNGVVTAVADGTAIISATLGDYTGSCIVRCVDVTGNRGVNRDDSPYVVNYQDVTLNRKGEYFQLTLSSVDGKEVPEHTWKSDDSTVATVDNKGIVTAVDEGVAYITSTIGEDTFQCVVRVSFDN